MTLRFFYLTTHRKSLTLHLRGNEHDWKRGLKRDHSALSGTFIAPVY